MLSSEESIDPKLTGTYKINVLPPAMTICDIIKRQLGNAIHELHCDVRCMLAIHGLLTKASGLGLNAMAGPVTSGRSQKVCVRTSWTFAMQLPSAWSRQAQREAPAQWLPPARLQAYVHRFHPTGL